MKILAVDDEDTALAILDLTLRYAGYEDFDMVNTAAEALSCLERSAPRYDCVIIDAKMPDIDGVDLCASIRRIPKYSDVPIIVVTASQDPTLLDKALCAGATDFMEKPFDSLEVTARLKFAALIAETYQTKTLDAFFHEKDKDLEQLNLIDVFVLSEVQNVLSSSEFANAVVEASIAEPMNLLFLSIQDLEELYPRQLQIAFLSSLNEIAAKISVAADDWDPKVAYMGEGDFVIAVFGELSEVACSELIEEVLAEISSGGPIKYNGPLTVHVKRLARPKYVAPSNVPSGIHLRQKTLHAIASAREASVAWRALDGTDTVIVSSLHKRTHLRSAYVLEVLPKKNLVTENAHRVSEVLLQSFTKMGKRISRLH